MAIDAPAQAALGKQWKCHSKERPLMSAASSCTVLNVDDNQAARYVRTKILERAGCRVFEAGTGSEALDLIRRERPALAVLDVKLPDMSGLDIVIRLKEDPTTSDTMVLQISAYYTSSIDRTIALKGGADSYLMEPVPAEEFLASVQALLRLHAREEEYRRLLRDLNTRGAEEQVLLASKDRTQAQDQIRHLAARLGTVKEQEREKLAQSLHDDLAQLLVVARLKVQQQSRRPAEQTMREIDTVLDQCLTYARSLVSDLMPPELCQGELNAALRWLVAPMRAHGLTVMINVPDDAVILAKNTTMTIVKCARELLFNVLKHADTQEAFLTMVVTEDMLRVIVQDHGKGCEATPGDGSTPHTFGLFSVQQRMELLGGRLEITSRPGAGTRATLTVPRDAPSPP